MIGEQNPEWRTNLRGWARLIGAVLIGNGLVWGGLRLWDRLGLDVPASTIWRYEERTINVSPESGRGVDLRYRYLPPAGKATRHSVPLVVFLHGAGQRGTDNIRQLRHLPEILGRDNVQSRYACAVLAPQCPDSGWWTSKVTADSDLLDAVAAMMDEILADQRIDPSRVYLTGLSMGGFGAWELGMRVPERFAAIVPICGGGETTRAAALVGTPIYAVHGAADSVVPVSQSQVMIAALKKAGGNPHYAELEGVGHNSWEIAYEPGSEVMRWMFEQKRGPGRQGAR